MYDNVLLVPWLLWLHYVVLLLAVVFVIWAASSGRGGR